MQVGFSAGSGNLNLEYARHELPEQHPGDDAQEDPDGQVALKKINGINP